MSVRERVKAIAMQMLGNQPTPAQIRQFEVSLAGLLHPISDEMRESELAYKRALLEANAKTAVGKRQIAEAGPEFARLLEAKATHETCMEMLRTCRSHGRSLAEEMRLQR